MTAPFNGTHFGWTQPDAAWEQLLRPWFVACARLGWESGQAGTAVLLAPDTGSIAWVKGKVVAEGIGCLGVHFHTPGTLRALLCGAYGVETRLALREDLHLLMGQAARSLPDNPVAQAAAIDPATFTRLCDRLDRADWRQEGFAVQAGRELSCRYFELLGAQGLRTAAQVERELLERAQASPMAVCGHLLAVGFGPEHSDALLLLCAAVLSAGQAPILCLDTRADAAGNASQLLLAWQASCEEAFGPPLPLPEAALADTEATGATGSPVPLDALKAWADALATHHSVDDTLRPALQRQLRLQVFRSLKEEAENAVANVCHWLGQAPASFSGDGSALAEAPAPAVDEAPAPLRIGIILPAGGSLLGREIAARLGERGIAHYDSLGHQPARTPAQRLLENWCAWQTSNQLDDFTTFLAELVGEGWLSARALHQWERVADKALAQTLCPELSVIFAFLNDESRASSAQEGEPLPPPGQETTWRHILARWPALPAEASFATFWAHTAAVLAGFGWPQRLEPLLERATAFAASFTAPLPRSAFIAWLRSVVQVPGRTRSACGHEPFAPVQLVTLAEASRQRWTHLCLVGMVHGLWPPVQTDSALLDAARCTWLNRRAERPSRFGQGQSCLGGGHTYLVSATEQRELFSGAFVRLLRHSGATTLALSRYRFEPGANQAEAFGSECFLRAVYAATGALEIAETEATAPRPNEADVSTRLPLPQLATAYLRRRDPQTGFDGYSYGLLTPPPQPLRLSCSHWAEVLNRPANAWYRYVLRVRKRRLASQTDLRRQSQGVWIHRWVNPSPEAEAVRGGRTTPQFLPRPDAALWCRLVADRASALQRQVEAGYRRAGRQLPQWWQSDWSAALATATAFAETLAGADTSPVAADSTVTTAADTAAVTATDATVAANMAAAWGCVAGEYPLPAVRLDLPGHLLNGLELEGIVDLLLSPLPPLPPLHGQDGAQAATLAAHPALWVVDYKTGADDPLSIRSWESRGAGLQLVLYALALQAHGVPAVQMTVLKKDGELSPQLNLDDLDPQAPIWQRLRAPVRDGIFGIEGALRDSHTFRGDYPLATLPIDPVILERKAALTFADR